MLGELDLPSGCTTNVFFKGEATMVKFGDVSVDIGFTLRLPKTSKLNWKT